MRFILSIQLCNIYHTICSKDAALDTLHIENSKFLRGVVWKILEPLTYLRILNIYFNKVKTLGDDFNAYTTKELQQITFYGTETTLIKPGTFLEFTKLSKIAMDNCKLTEITRDIFPVPFNVQILHFNQNKLTAIPDDLFSNMPNLQTVGLKYNQISVIPESSFEGSFSKLQFLLLEGNPMICDCRLAWLIKDKPEAVSGECHFPSKLKGKDIKDVESDYLKC
ncbi:uncharacterized protein CDAR_403371 [Caerostris darwini]|uniref:LRRCT domain-containing protein n=1 Tax=Caerostris darwini TaxID=1538125 RepID=A0AAV4UTA0_9ARAC|nr:uncharacterized protein CDAR_403371 [Caerostris darwini]